MKRIPQRIRALKCLTVCAGLAIGTFLLASARRLEAGAASASYARALPIAAITAATSAATSAMYSGDDGSAPGCPGSLFVGLNYQGDMYYGTATQSYGSLFSSTYTFTAWDGSMWVTGIATLGVMDCLVIDLTGSTSTLDYSVTGWGMGS